MINKKLDRSKRGGVVVHNFGLGVPPAVYEILENFFHDFCFFEAYKRRKSTNGVVISPLKRQKEI